MSLIQPYSKLSVLDLCNFIKLILYGELVVKYNIFMLHSHTKHVENIVHSRKHVLWKFEYNTRDFYQK